MAISKKSSLDFLNTTSFTMVHFLDLGVQAASLFHASKTRQSSGSLATQEVCLSTQLEQVLKWR